MPLVGERMTCRTTRRVGYFVARTSTGYTCRDANGYFVIEKTTRGKRKSGEWRPSRNGGEVNPELVALAERIRASK